MHRQTVKTTLSEGGGEGKHFCDYDCVSIPGKEEISTRFWFVSTSFVRGCSLFGLYWENIGRVLFLASLGLEKKKKEFVDEYGPLASSITSIYYTDFIMQLFV